MAPVDKSEPEPGGIARPRDPYDTVLPPSDFGNHIYLVGGSGSGKTSLIRIMAKYLETWNYDGTLPNAFIYVDPKGEDSYKFIRQCGQAAVDEGRVHLLDPQKTMFSINPLELPAHRPEERDEVVSRYVGHFMKMIEEWYQQSASFVQMERIFRALLFYIYKNHDAPTFLDIHEIILEMQQGGDTTLQHIIDTYGEPDPDMKQALTSISGLKGEAFTPLLNRVEQFATDPVLKRMFSVRHGTVDFAELIRPGRFTVVRISPLNVPHHAQPLAMQTFILKLWFEIQDRANRITDEDERTQVVLALDEFQVVKDLQALQLMLEQARSLGLGLVLSHQTAEQISDRQLGLITGNSGTILVGKVNGMDAARLAQILEPQFKSEMTQQLASQEYTRWTMREKAAPGTEQALPRQFWLHKPPQLLVSKDRYANFLSGQIARYGGGVVEYAMAKQAAFDKEKWQEGITVRFPPRMEWDIMSMLLDRPLRQVEMVGRLRVSNRSEVLEVLQGMAADGLVRKADPDNRQSAYELTALARTTYFEPDFGEVGSARETAEVTSRVFYTYLRRGMFVSVASQKIAKGQDRTDLIAYDYDRNVPISVEIESASEVQSHPEHVRYNMTKWRQMGFGMCHVWSKSPRIQDIYDSLTDEERTGVRISVI